MKKTKLTRSLLAACSIVALSAVMYGCSSGGDDARDALQSELDALQGALPEGQELNPETLQQVYADKAAAEAEVTLLMGELGMAQADVARLTTELATATGNAVALQTQLNAAQAEVTRLTGELGMANSRLSDANDKVTRITVERDAAVTAKMTAEGERDAAVTAKMTAEGERDAANLAKMTADGERDAANLAKMTAEGERDAAVGEKNAAISERDTAIEARDRALMDDQTDQDTIDGLNSQIGTLNTTITGLENTITQKDTEIAGKQTEINNLNTQITGLNSQISAKDLVIATHTSTITALNARIDELETQLAAAGSEEDHFRARQVAALISPVDENGVTMAGMFSTLPDELMDDVLLANLTVDPGGNHTLDNYMSKAAPPRFSDKHGTWPGATLVEDLTGGSDSIVYVYSDVEAPKPESFGTAYGMLGGTAPEIMAHITDNVLDEEAWEKAKRDYRSTLASVDFLMQVLPGAAKYAGADEVDDLADSAVQFWKLAVSSHFPAQPTAGRDVSRQFDLAEEVAGSFDGVSGNFVCKTPAGCFVVNDSEDGPSSKVAVADGNNPGTADAEWDFVAGDPDAYVDTDRKDGDYLILGWWLEKPDAEEGTHAFAPFYAGRDPFVASDIGALGGTADYKGPAAGKYAKRSRGSNEAEAGIFRADATLMANFDNNAVVSGTVDKFVGEDGQSLGDWNVVLVAGTTIGNMFTGDVESETSRADGRPWETGAWEGQFYGNNHDSGKPGSVAGMFHARWGTPDMMEGDAAPSDEGFVGVGGSYGAHYYVAPPADDE